MDGSLARLCMAVNELLYERGSIDEETAEMAEITLEHYLKKEQVESKIIRGDHHGYY